MPGDPLQIIFLLAAAVILVSAILAVTLRNLVHAALWMVLSFFAVGILFVLLGAGFFAVVQVVVYIGAIALLILFVIMLTRREAHEQEAARTHYWWIAIIPVTALLAGLVFVMISFPGSRTPISMTKESELIKELGRALVDPGQFGLAFEVASLLLLVALIGSVYMARDRKSEKGEDK
jgi:NADH-quinone oxidoreductase subunit J